MPEIRIDPLSGHRDDRRRASARDGRAARRRCQSERVLEPIDPERDPFADGHEDRTPPELYAVAPGRRCSRLAWLDGARRAEPIPGAEPAGGLGGGSAGERRGERLGDGHDTRRAPARSSARRSCSTSLPATGAHEVIVNGPQPVLSLAELPARAGRRGDGGLARADARARAMRIRAADRQRAPPGRAHRCRTRTRSCMGSTSCPAAVARERERAGAYATRTMGQSLLGDLVAEEVRLRERIVAIDEEAVLMAPFASRLPFQLMLAPRRPVRALRAGRADGRGAAARWPATAGAPPRLEPAAEPVGAHGAARRRALLLADRRGAAADAPRRTGALDRTST